MAGYWFSSPTLSNQGKVIWRPYMDLTFVSIFFRCNLVGIQFRATKGPLKKMNQIWWWLNTRVSEIEAEGNKGYGDYEQFRSKIPKNFSSLSILAAVLSPFLSLTYRELSTTSFLTRVSPMIIFAICSSRFNSRITYLTYAFLFGWFTDQKWQIWLVSSLVYELTWSRFWMGQIH